MGGGGCIWSHERLLFGMLWVHITTNIYYLYITISSINCIDKTLANTHVRKPAYKHEHICTRTPTNQNTRRQFTLAHVYYNNHHTPILLSLQLSSFSRCMISNRHFITYSIRSCININIDVNKHWCKQTNGYSGSKAYTVNRPHLLTLYGIDYTMNMCINLHC